MGMPMRISYVCVMAVCLLLYGQGVGADATAPPEPAPPAGQTYTGAKDCASCHFEQFMSWSKSKHAKSFELLPAKYQSDEKCLTCHTTGYGEETGFKDIKTTKALAGTTCESCHGPGSKHDEIARGYGKAKLTPEQEKEVRDSIWLVLPGNSCVECHTVQGHKKSETPEELRPK